MSTHHYLLADFHFKIGAFDFLEGLLDVWGLVLWRLLFVGDVSFRKLLNVVELAQLQLVEASRVARGRGGRRAAVRRPFRQGRGAFADRGRRPCRSRGCSPQGRLPRYGCNLIQAISKFTHITSMMIIL